jgi:hypothetical protein
MADGNKSDVSGNTQTVAVGEAKVVVFTEYRKPIPGTTDEHAVFHLTVRESDYDEADEVALERLKWWDTNLTNMGFTHGDAPKKNNYVPRGGSGAPKAPRADVPDSGIFQVANFALYQNDKGKSLRVIGPNGEEVKDWGGKNLDAIIKAVAPAASQPFLNWADWKVDEPHPVPWTTHKLMAHCAKSNKTDKNGKPYWDLKQLVVE